jgi:hypothetical protein
MTSAVGSTSEIGAQCGADLGQEDPFENVT